VKLFVKKGKVLKISRGKEAAVKIHTGLKEICSNMNKFCCLGNMITTYARSNREIKRRIAIVKIGIPKEERTPERTKSKLTNDKNMAI